MDIEKQVISLDLAKKLNQLGVKKPSYMWWRNDFADNPRKYEDKWYLIPDSDYPCTGEHESRAYDNNWYLLAAYSVAELGEILPAGMQSNRIDFKDGDQWHCWAWNFGNTFFEKTEANARAKMLIYFIEKDLITLPV